MGVERSLFLARRLDPTVSKEDVKKVVRECEQCQKIDPAPTVHEAGELYVGNNWERLAIDVTHYRNTHYFSIVDCGPGRFAIWRELKHETAECIVTTLEQIFYERGPVTEVLMDNATVFRSEKMLAFLGRWYVRPCFRAAYRPSGNGIVERHHRTIKAIAERGGINPIEAVFWYNMSPRSGQNASTVPQCAVHSYEWRHPMLQPNIEKMDSSPVEVRVGEEVWVKPPDARCTSHWTKGVITNINSACNVEVNRMPRHILDIRRVIPSSIPESSSADDSTSPSEVPSEDVRRYPQRDRHPPQWMSDYIA